MERALIEKLKAAGIGSDVILDLILTDGEPAKEEKQPEEPGKKVEEKQPEVNKDPILEAIKELTGVVRSQNFNTLTHGGSGGETANDILARVLKGDSNEEVPKR